MPTHLLSSLINTLYFVCFITTKSEVQEVTVPAQGNCPTHNQTNMLISELLELLVGGFSFRQSQAS